MSPVMILPDVAPVVRGFLQARAEIQALVGNRVHIIYLPATKAWPCILLTSFTQESVTPHEDKTTDSLVQVEAYGRTQDDWAHSRLICATAHALLRGGLASYVHDVVQVSAVLPAGGLQPLPDDEHAKARWIASVRVIAYPHAVPA